MARKPHDWTGCVVCGVAPPCLLTTTDSWSVVVRNSNSTGLGLKTRQTCMEGYAMTENRKPLINNKLEYSKEGLELFEKARNAISSLMEEYYRHPQKEIETVLRNVLGRCSIDHCEHDYIDQTESKKRNYRSGLHTYKCAKCGKTYQIDTSD